MTSEAHESDARQDQYLLGYGIAAKQFATRSLSQHGSFFLPYLKSGMSLLDCGCGPGTITVELAGVLTPGEVVGVDIGDSQIEGAQNLAKERNISNVRFQVASVYELPFPDESFDAVFSHATLEHLLDPKKAVQEMKRVLKTGGVIGIRSGIHRKDVIEPYDSLLEKAFLLSQQTYSKNGQDPYVGGKLRGLLTEEGFENVMAGASYDNYSTEDTTSTFGETMMNVMRERILDFGLADQSELDEIRAAWERWGKHPHAFLARARGHAVGWKA